MWTERDEFIEMDMQDVLDKWDERDERDDREVVDELDERSLVEDWGSGEIDEMDERDEWDERDMPDVWNKWYERDERDERCGRGRERLLVEDWDRARWDRARLTTWGPTDQQFFSFSIFSRNFCLPPLYFPPPLTFLVCAPLGAPHDEVDKKEN
jgi:hypothetical protein